MTWQMVGADALLVIGVAIELLCCLGVLVMEDGIDRIHYLGPASTLGPMALAGAIILHEALSSAGIMAILIAVVLVGGGPVLAHATARAARLRGHDSWRPRPDEQIEEVGS
jgi:multicomponent Na+:H+ antiporter subunit G